MPTTYSIPEVNIPVWVSNVNQIGVSSFVDDMNYQTVSQVAIVSNILTTQLNAQIATINTKITTLAGNTASQFNNVYSYINIVQGNLYSVSNTLSTSIVFLNNNVASQVATLSSQITIFQGNIASIGASVSNIRGDIANIYSTSTLQYSNIYSTIANIHPSNLSGYIQYSNLSSIDVRMIGNTSNILYSGQNVSSLYNDSGYITNNSSPTFNNITINGVANAQILNATVDIASPMIYSTDIDVSNAIIIGTPPNCIVLSVVAGRDGKVNALQIAQDALGGVSMLMDGFGIASGILGSLKGLTNASGAPAEDLEEQLESDTSSGNISIAVDWASIKRAPIGFMGTTVKKCAIQSDLYTGGSLYYDSSIVDITENGYGSVQFNSTSSGLKMIDGQSQTAYFTDVKASGNVKTDDIRPYTSGTPLYIYADINSQGNISSQLYITSTKDISTSANISSNYLIATNNITSNTINTTGFVGSRVKFFQDVEFVGNVRCDTNEAVYGALTANSVYVNYDTTVGGNIQCNNLFFGGNVYYNSSIVQFSQWSGNTKQISYGGNVLVSGNIVATNYFINSSNIQQYILNTVGNNYWVGNTNSISTTANASVNNLAVNNLTASGNGTIYCYSNVVFVNSSLTLDPADLIVELDAVVWGNLTVLTDVVVSNDLLAQNIYSFGNLIVSSQFTGNTSNLSTRANVSILGNLSVSNQFYIGTQNLQSYILSTVGNVNISYSNITNIYSNVINTTNIYSSNIVSNSISTNTITIGGNTINQYIFNTISNTINTTIVYSSNIVSNSLSTNNIYIAGNSLSTYITNVVGNVATANISGLVSNVYLQNTYVNNAYIQSHFAPAGSYVSNNTSYNFTAGIISGTTVSTTGNGQINQAKIGDAGFGGSTFGAFAHSSQFTTTNYSLLCSNIGETFINSATGQPIYFRNNNADIGRWTSTGLGIGTTTPAYPLDVIGQIRVFSSTNPRLLIQGTGGGASPCYIDLAPYNSGAPAVSLSVIDDGNYSGHMLWLMKTPGASGNSQVEKMRFTDVGNLGIGTTSPAYTLDVNGSARITGTLNMPGNTYNLTFNTNSVIQSTGTSSVSDLCLSSYGGFGIRILPTTGYVGIGGATTITGFTPSYTLDVNGTARFTGTLLVNLSGTGGTGLASFLQPSLATNTNSYITIGTGVSTNNCGYINFQNYGAANASNNMGFGIWGASAYAQMTPTGMVVGGTLSSTGTTSIASGSILATTGAVDIYQKTYLHTIATVNTTSVLNNAALTVAGNTYTTALQVGNYSTTSLAGASLNTGIVQISNPTSVLGPHHAAYTNSDNYPLHQFLNYSHDNVYLSFDMYWDGAWRTSYNAINYQISKVSGVLQFTYCNATTAGSTITQTNTMTINQNRVCLNGSSTTYQFLINGYSLQDSLMAVFRNGTTNPVFNIQGTTVGINQVTNSYNLDVNGNMRVVNGAYFNGSDSIAMGTISYLTPTATTYSAAFGGSTAGYAIIGGRIRGSQIDIFSDRRIKTDITPRDTKKDLELLSKIPMRNYTYIDKIHHSAKPHLGVISQEIENIVPDAVNHSKHTIPDVYKTYDIIEIDDKTFTIVGATLEDKTKVRMYYAKDGAEIKFKGLVDGKNVIHKQGKLNTDKVFVYGKEIDDFLNVNYNHLYSMNLGATQELYSLIQKQNDRIDDLERKLEQFTKYTYQAGRI